MILRKETETAEWRKLMEELMEDYPIRMNDTP